MMRVRVAMLAIVLLVAAGVSADTCYANGVNGQLLTSIEDNTVYGETVLAGLVAYYPFNGNANDASGNGDGTFQTHVNYPAIPGAHARGLAAGDFNGDGRFDVAIGNQSYPTISIFLQMNMPTDIAKPGFSVAWEHDYGGQRSQLGHSDRRRHDRLYRQYGFRLYLLDKRCQRPWENDAGLEEPMCDLESKTVAV